MWLLLFMEGDFGAAFHLERNSEIMAAALLVFMGAQLVRIIVSQNHIKDVFVWFFIFKNCFFFPISIIV
jgi:hypothetical protein